MAIFGRKGKKEISNIEKEIPEFRAWAFANASLKEFLKENPFLVKEASYVKWDAEYGKDEIVAKGTINIPVEMVFSLGEVNNGTIYDDLKLESVSFNGEKVNEEVVEEVAAKFDPLDTINMAHALAEAKKKSKRKKKK